MTSKGIEINYCDLNYNCLTLEMLKELVAYYKLKLKSSQRKKADIIECLKQHLCRNPSATHHHYMHAVYLCTPRFDGISVPKSFKARNESGDELSIVRDIVESYKRT